MLKGIFRDLSLIVQLDEGEPKGLLIEFFGVENVDVDG